MAEAGLAGKAVVVTGGGRGIGAALCAYLGARGVRVVVNDIDRDVAEAVARGIVAAGGEALAHAGDVAEWDAAAAMVALCRERFGAIDGLVNNAGLYELGRLDELEKGAFERILAVNVVGTANCAAHAARAMVAQGSGSIVNVVSGAHMGLPAMGVYGASKGAVASLTYTWAAELAGTGVRVNAVSPLAMDTRMAEVGREYMGARGMARPTRMVPAERNPPVHAWLLSDAAAAVNGQIVRIEGEQLSLVAHPSVMLPVLEREGGWTLESVDAAFAGGLAARQFPLGITGTDIAGFGPPSRAWAEAREGQ